MNVLLQPPIVIEGNSSSSPFAGGLSIEGDLVDDIIT
jgi:hypothetical protein